MRNSSASLKRSQHYCRAMNSDTRTASNDSLRFVFKRIFDVIAAVMGLVILSPLLLLIGISIRLFDGGPVFYRQTRVGRYGQTFEVYKFRTMTVSQDEDAPQITAANDQRITKIGRHLRHHKLDELPQLLNVMLGEMSIVGPRPEVPQFVERYPADQRDIILSVRPGITDLASIEFREEMSLLSNVHDPQRFYVDDILPRKLELYVRYVREWSLLFDFRIIFRTIVKLAGK